ncbi:MAG: 2-C-methyl-D-erythritol 4-phosphate cytidylyltransferase [Armatimonadetes bacterium]|nr:2-C-methyl-D-erythritol 4-phosphate cytidylyltransferase [Armatimonadota bacterium]
MLWKGDFVPTVAAIIAAAGVGTRMGTADAKQFLPLRGRPMLVHTLDAFERCSAVDEVCLVVREQEIARVRRLVAHHGLRKVTRVVPGGEVRQDSVYNGLLALEGAEIVIVHDGVRPLVTPEAVAATVQAAVEAGAAILATKVTDTIKAADDGVVMQTVDRATLWAAQTPQAFRYALLRTAHERARDAGVVGTDDATLVERLGQPVRIVPGPPENLKIATPADLELAEAILSRRRAAESTMSW